MESQEVNHVFFFQLIPSEPKLHDCQVDVQQGLIDPWMNWLWVCTSMLATGSSDVIIMLSPCRTD